MSSSPRPEEGAARIAGASLRWRLGASARGLHAALAWLARDDAGADAIEIVHEDRAPAAPPGRSIAFFGSIRAATSEESAVLWAPGLRFDVDFAAARVFGASSGADLREVERACTLALHLALRTRDVFHVHAAAVRLDDREILLPGGSGRGKTTSCLSLIEAGALCRTDDAAYLVPAERAALTGWPRALHVTPRTLEAFPHLARRAGALLDEGEAKRELDLSGIRALGGSDEVASVDVVLVPEIVACAKTFVAPIARDEVFAALVGCSGLALLPGVPNRASNIARLAEIASNSRAGRLGLGADALARPAVVADVIREWLSR